MNVRKLFCETCDGAAKPSCRTAGHVLKRRYATNKGLRKFCQCARRTWETCSHPYYFNYKGERGALSVSEPDDAKRRFSTIKAEIDNGTYQRSKQQPATTPAVERPTFAVVADDYAKRWIKRELSERAKQYHDRAMLFLAGVTVPPGVTFAEKPFHLIIRADVTTVIDVKRTPTVKTYQKGEKTWTRTVGGDVAGNRLRDYLCGLWNWAIGEGYADVTPFVRIGGGRSAIKKKSEDNRSRRLRDGEEAGLLKTTKDANPHLNDCIVAALEAGMRKGEILSLQWKQVRWLQNELHLPGGKTKTKKPRQIPISPTLREILTRRQTGITKGPEPKTFTFGQDHYVFGNEAGGRIKNVKTAWETAVLRAHGVPVERKRGKLSTGNRARLAEIDLNFHDLRHEAGSRKLEAGWPLHAVSLWLGHTKISTTEKYLNVKTDYLHELNERPKPLTLVRA